MCTGLPNVSEYSLPRTGRHGIVNLSFVKIKRRKPKMKKLFALMLALMLALAGVSAVSAEDAAAAEAAAPEEPEEEEKPAAEEEAEELPPKETFFEWLLRLFGLGRKAD